MTAVEWLETINFNIMIKVSNEEQSNNANVLLVVGAFKQLTEWLLINKRSVFMDADIPKESKKKIMNELGYSSNSLDDQHFPLTDWCYTMVAY